MSTTNELQGIWTQYGLEKAGQLLAEGKKIKFTHAAVGSGGGGLPVVKPSQTELVSEEWRGAVNGVMINPEDPTDVIVSMVLPLNVGGFWVREWGVFDEDGGLVAVGPHDEMRKSAISSGQASEFLERFHLPVANADTQVNLSVASQALATQDWVKGQIGAHNAVKLDLGAHLFTMGLEGQVLTVKNGQLVWHDPLDYFLGWYVFCGGLHPDPTIGMEPVDGSWIEDVDQIYPQAWAFLQSARGQQLCVTAEVYQALNTDVFRKADGTPIVLADGTSPGWKGVGGVPKYCLDIPNRRLRLPDLRGTYIEPAGCDSLGVASVGGDQMRNLFGWITDRDLDDGVHGILDSSGVFYNNLNLAATAATITRSTVLSTCSRRIINTARTVPTGAAFAPRRFGSLACVYLGKPAS
jgi:hypothetical protein